MNANISGVGARPRFINAVLRAVGTVAATVLGAGCAAGGSTPAGVGVIPLDLSGPRPTAELALNGAPAVRAIFDTGAAASVVQLSYAEVAKLPHDGAGYASGPGGVAIPGFRTHISGRLGAAAFQSKLAVALDIPLPLPGVEAVISPGVFAGRLVRFDFKAGEAQVLDRSDPRSPTSPGYDYSGSDDAAHINRVPSIPMLLPNGVTVPATVDTGARRGIELPMAFAGALTLAGPLVPTAPVRLIGIEHPAASATLVGDLKMGSITLHNPSVTFVEGVKDGSVGFVVLKSLTLTLVLDPERHRDWLLPAGGQGLALTARHSGGFVSSNAPPANECRLGQPNGPEKRRY